MHPVRSGYRAVFRQPALILAEVAWRWSFGAAAWVLAVLSIRRVLAGIDVSEAEYLLARRSDMFLIADACARILYQALPALARASAIVIPAVVLIWMIAATLGRAATLRSIFAECHPERASTASESKDPYPPGALLPARWHFGSLFSLNFLRTLFTLATLTAVIGTLILAGIAFPAPGNPTAAALIWVTLVALAAFFWSLINWFLALAPIWIVRDGRGAFRAIVESVSLFRRNSGAYVSAASWFGFLRTLILLAAFIAALIAASVFESTRAGAAASLLIALLYFAFADFLYIARMAAFVALAGESPQPSAVNIQPLAPAPQPLTTSES